MNKKFEIQFKHIPANIDEQLKIYNISQSHIFKEENKLVVICNNEQFIQFLNFLNAYEHTYRKF